MINIGKTYQAMHVVAAKKKITYQQLILEYPVLAISFVYIRNNCTSVLKRIMTYICTYVQCKIFGLNNIINSLANVKA